VNPAGPVVSFGKFRVVRELARGGMGEVFLTQQTGPAGFSRLAVVKRILPAQELNSTVQELFLDEARIAAQLTHPNIVQVYDLGEADQSYYIAMEFVRGVTVGTLIRGLRKQQQTLDPVVAVTIAIGALRGLHYAHTATDQAGVPLQVVHRDISPENLMVTREGVTKVLDFGIAKASTRSTQTGEGLVRGKIAYLSPEQLLGEVVDARSDIRAMGVVLCEMLSGSRYVDPNLDTAQFARSLLEEPQPTVARFPHIPASLATILDHALRRLPKDRFQTAELFAEALDGWKRQAAPMPISSLTSMVKTFDSMPESGLKATPAPSPAVASQAVALHPNDVEVLQSADIVNGSPAGIKPLRLAAIGVGVFFTAMLAVFVGSSLFFKAAPPAPPPAPKPTPAVVQPRKSETPHPDAATLEDTNEETVARPAPAPEEPRRLPTRPGSLDLRVSPWATVSVDGKAAGETPLAPLELSAGVHSVVLVNPDLRVTKTVSVRVTAGERVTLKVDLLE
jgi:eukaryotic-like serine/threonine-protein kinase